MRLYYMFHMQEQYEQFMVGREQQLFQLLSGYVHARRNEKEMAYICREIDVTSIQVLLEERMKKYFKIVQKSTTQFELIHELKGTIFITIDGHQLCAVCDGSRMLDLDLFIALSGEGDRYFAFMDGQREWGWLKPFKHPQEIVERMTVFR
ncbi:MAG TPA: sporulation inhibitor of replication protein SirA [Sporosarcina sp.]|nr:sporulation inhibitor of replication protein SirA [Sporosarcina sp.]